MYLAKAAGKNRARRLRRRHGRRPPGTGRSSAEDLAAALAGDQLEVHYQPTVALRRRSGQSASRRCCAGTTPQRGVVPPDEFIPLAEETGLIVPASARGSCARRPRQAAAPGRAARARPVDGRGQPLPAPAHRATTSSTPSRACPGRAPACPARPADPGDHRGRARARRRRRRRPAGAAARARRPHRHRRLRHRLLQPVLPAAAARRHRSRSTGPSSRDLRRRRAPPPPWSRRIIELARSLGLDVVAEGVETRSPGGRCCGACTAATPRATSTPVRARRGRRRAARHRRRSSRPTAADRRARAFGRRPQHPGPVDACKTSVGRAGRARRQRRPNGVRSRRGRREVPVGAVEDVVDQVVPKLEADASAIHAGDVEPRMALWSRNDPVTLFGAVMTRSGWDELEPAFVRLAASFGRSESCRLEVMAAGRRGDLGYVRRDRALSCGADRRRVRPARHDGPETRGRCVAGGPPARRPVRRGESHVHAVTARHDLRPLTGSCSWSRGPCSMSDVDAPDECVAGTLSWFSTIHTSPAELSVLTTSSGGSWHSRARWCSAPPPARTSSSPSTTQSSPPTPGRRLSWSSGWRRPASSRSNACSARWPSGPAGGTAPSPLGPHGGVWSCGGAARSGACADVPGGALQRSGRASTAGAPSPATCPGVRSASSDIAW